jgi:hypothetical protein
MPFAEDTLKKSLLRLAAHVGGLIEARTSDWAARTA